MEEAQAGGSSQPQRVQRAAAAQSSQAWQPLLAGSSKKAGAGGKGGESRPSKRQSDGDVPKGDTDRRKKKKKGGDAQPPDAMETPVKGFGGGGGSGDEADHEQSPIRARTTLRLGEMTAFHNPLDPVSREEIAAPIKLQRSARLRTGMWRPPGWVEGTSVGDLAKEWMKLEAEEQREIFTAQASAEEQEANGHLSGLVP
jgi:hypothetical protein